MNQKAKKVDSINNTFDGFEEKNQLKPRRLDINTLLKRLADKKIKDKKTTVVTVVSVLLIISIVIGIKLVQ